MDVQELTDRVSNMESVVESAVTIITELAADVRALRNEGGGALQAQVDKLSDRIKGSAQKLAESIAKGTAADHEVHDVDQPSAGAGDDGGVGGEIVRDPDGNLPSGDVPKGAAQAAVDHLNDQAGKEPM